MERKPTARDPVRVTRNGRRYFSKAHKEAVIAKCLTPGSSLAAVAPANGFNPNVVRKWVRKRQAREALAGPRAKLVPVALTAEQVSAVRQDSLRQSAVTQAAVCESGSMQIRIGAIELTVRGVVERAQLAMVLEVLLRSR